MKGRLVALSIRTQLMLMMGLATAMALLIASVAVAVSDYRSGHESLIQRLQTQADITAFNTVAAVAFEDTEAAAKTLQGLAADRAIVRVEVQKANGGVLARVAYPTQHLHAGRLVEVSAEIKLTQTIGTVHLWASTAEVDALILKQLAIVGVVLAGVLLLTVGASAGLQRIVSQPITALSQAASAVSSSRDYHLAKVTVRGSREVRELGVAFNSMLEELEVRKQQLDENQSQLEKQVETRTAELGSALKEAQQAARSKAEFLANMSHEIRTPMNGVIGMLDLLRGMDIPNEAQAMLDVAGNSADSMLILINDILDFSKIDAGKLVLENIDIELRPLAEDVASLFMQQAQAKGVEIVCAIHNDVPLQVGGDPTRLRQIMANLLGNAVKFTEQGEVLLGIRLHTPSKATAISYDPATHDVLQLIVRDSGIGMSEEVQKGLFAAFTQADSSTTRKYGGTGLGLAISKRLVDAMGGSIKVTSQIGRGTTFSIYLPFEKRNGRVARTQPISAKKCLIVDDNATNRSVLEHYLQAETVSFASADSATSALRLIREEACAGRPFDIILLDYQMPIMDGLGLLRDLRSDSMIAKTRCVILSSLGQRVPEADDLRVDAWLTKPIRIAQLHSVLAGGAGYDSVPRVGTKTANAIPSAALRVLVVEDNIVNQKVAGHLLKTLGVTADIVENGERAVAAIKTGLYGLVFMDCQMPVMDGYEATRAVREWEAAEAVAGRSGHIVIIAMTAHALSGDREKCLEAGMDDYLTKPIKRDAVSNVIKLYAARHDAVAADLKPQVS